MTTPNLINLVLTTLSLTDNEANRLFVLSGLNAAQKWAELKHDWKFTNAVGYIALGATGWDLTGTGVLPTAPGAWWSALTCPAFKHVRSFIRMDDETTEVVLNYVQRGTQQRLQNRANYSSDGSKVQADLVMDGYLVGWYDITTPEAFVRIEGFAATPELADVEDDANWFTEHGWEFLLWYAVCFCNITVQKFVNRQEGTLSPPTKERDAAFETLLSFDCYLNDEFNEHRIIA